jgi:hypothetical protein
LPYIESRGTSSAEIAREAFVKPPPLDIVGRRGIVAAVLLFAAGFCLSAAIIHLFLPPPIQLYAAMRSEKLILLAQWSGRATSAAFGSSHAHNGFDPRAFDHSLGGMPLPTTSLNLGVEGGSQSEQRIMAINFLSQLRPRANNSCFLLLELNAGANLTYDHLVHPRAIDIYDWTTVRFIGRLSPLALGAKRAAGRVLYALMASSLHYSNVGMLSNLIFAPPTDQQLIAEQTEDDRRGLLPPKLPASSLEHVRQQLASSARTMTPVSVSLLPGNYDLLSELHRLSPIRNVQIIYWVSPRIDNLQSYPVYPPELTVDGFTAPIISASRPDLYPDLYRAQNWADESHLNEKGAAVMSRYLAIQMSDWYQRYPKSLVCGD